MYRVLLVLLLLAFGRLAVAAPVTEGCIPLVVLAKADFDGDGKLDSLLGATTQTEGGYRSLLVKSAAGEVLLDLTDGRYFYVAEVGGLGAPNPVLIVGTPFGNKWAELAAWTFVPKSGFEQLRWHSSVQLVGRVPRIDSKLKRVVVTTEKGEKSFRYRDGALRQD